MKKILLLLAYALLAIPAYAQENWVKTIIDDYLTVSLPAPVSKIDTLGQTVFVGQLGDESKLIVTKLKMGADLQDDTFSLSNFYKGYMKGMTDGSVTHTILFSKNLAISNLQAFYFGYKYTDEGDYYSEVVVAFIRGITYNIMVVGSKQEDVSKAMEKLLKTTKFTVKEGLKAQIK